ILKAIRAKYGSIDEPQKLPDWCVEALYTDYQESEDVLAVQMAASWLHWRKDSHRPTWTCLLRSVHEHWQTCFTPTPPLLYRLAMAPGEKLKISTPQDIQDFVAELFHGRLGPFNKKEFLSQL